MTLDTGGVSGVRIDSIDGYVLPSFQHPPAPPGLTLKHILTKVGQELLQHIVSVRPILALSSYNPAEGHAGEGEIVSPRGVGCICPGLERA